MTIGHFGPTAIRYIDGDQELAIGSTVHVVVAGSSTPASLVASLVNPVPISNPVSVDASGFLEFWTIDAGSYDILVNGARIPVAALPVDGSGLENDNAEVYPQVTPSIEWFFAHGLLRIPNVAVYDQDGTELLASVTATDTDVYIRFAIPTAGKAVLT